MWRNKVITGNKHNQHILGFYTEHLHAPGQTKIMFLLTIQLEEK